MRAAALRQLGVRRPHDLLLWLPHRYDDHSTRCAVADLESGRAATVEGSFEGLKTIRLRGRRTMVRGRLVDSSGELAVVWFNRPYLARQVDPERRYRLHGEVRRKGRQLELLNPSVIAAADAPEGIVATYGRHGDIAPAVLAGWVEVLLDGSLPADDLPAEVSLRHALVDLPSALRELHRPSGRFSVGELNQRATNAHQRVVYERLWRQQRELRQRRRSRRQQAVALPVQPPVSSELTSLPAFELTTAQALALDEILADLGRPWPMHRLLQGEVGSGKTVVALLALEAVARSGAQAALMAPTELLAEQHWQACDQLLGGRRRVGLLTSSSAQPERLRRDLAEGDLDLVIGTHSLIQESTAFARLALVVIDEEHRFGVEQRRAFPDAVHRLAMTATPIPRSLALGLWGDLELSLLDELPAGRRPVTTAVGSGSDRARFYRHLRQRLEAGEQGFVVLPRVDGRGAAAIAREGAEIAAQFEAFGVSVVHGRLAADERRRRTRAFVGGERRLLVATTVIEVGLDVPRATVMIIEDAERYGLAQLHQLRGRVGRGVGASWCFALAGAATTQPAANRLAEFAECRDGFELSRRDLARRGPGELLGDRQAGLQDLPWELVEEWLPKVHRDLAAWEEGG
ncbi:MAG: DEAD/DEAH box helicase [Acidobacteriota bacterium]